MNDFTNAKKNLNEIPSDCEECAEFMTKIKPLFSEYEKDAEDIENRLKRCKSKCTEIFEKYNLQEDKLKIGDVFGYFGDFYSSFDKCQKDMQRRRDAKKSAENRKSLGAPSSPGIGKKPLGMIGGHNKPSANLMNDLKSVLQNRR